jgi:predicted small lipoprotein YifL
MNMRKTGLALLIMVVALSVAGCGPLLVGGAAVVVADEVIEQEQGADGLF